jgi:hypothetical protein
MYPRRFRQISVIREIVRQDGFGFHVSIIGTGFKYWPPINRVT